MTQEEFLEMFPSPYAYIKDGRLVYDCFMDLSYKGLTELPEKLEIRGSMNLMGNKLKELPKDMKVHGRAMFTFNAIDSLRLRSKVDINEDFIGWKKINGQIIKLRIPKEAKKCSTSAACRCDMADVLAIDGDETKGKTTTGYKYLNTEYTVGERVYANHWSPNPDEESTFGIHFFLTEQEAKDYSFGHRQ